MRYRQWLLVVVVAATPSLFGCQESIEDPSTHKVQHIVTEDGNYKFYIGKAVTDQIAETGSYVPRVRDWYSVITIPAAAITNSILSEEPITLSLCDPAHKVSLVDHVFLGPDAIAQREATNPYPDPHYQTTPEGEFIQTYRSGDKGVYGFVQVVQLDDGSLASAAAADFWIEYGNGFARGGGMLLGIPSTDDPHFEDPLLENRGCKAPH